MKKLKVIGNDAVFSKTVVNEVEGVPGAVNLCDAAMVSVKVGYVGSRMYDATESTDKSVPLRYEITGNTHNTVVLFIAGNDRRFQRNGDVRMEIAYSTDGEMMRKVFDSNIFTYLSATEYALALHSDNAQKYLEGYVVRTADDEGMEVTESILPLGSYTTYREGEYNLIKAIREDADAHNGRLTRNRYKFAYIANNEMREFLFDVVNFSDVYNPDKEVNTPSVTLVRMSFDGHIEIAANVWLCDATEQHYYDADGNIVYLVGVYRKELEDYNIIGTRDVFYCNWEWHDITTVCALHTSTTYQPKPSNRLPHSLQPLATTSKAERPTTYAMPTTSHIRSTSTTETNLCLSILAFLPNRAHTLPQKKISNAAFPHSNVVSGK